MYRITDNRLHMQEQRMSSPNEREGSEFFFPYFTQYKPRVYRKAYICNIHIHERIKIRIYGSLVCVCGEVWRYHIYLWKNTGS